VPGLQLLDVAAAASGSSAGSGWIEVESPLLALDYDLVLFAGAPLHRLSAGYIPACRSVRVAAMPYAMPCRGLLTCHALRAYALHTAAPTELCCRHSANTVPCIHHAVAWSAGTVATHRSYRERGPPVLWVAYRIASHRTAATV
jgi:hypothetical protein